MTAKANSGRWVALAIGCCWPLLFAPGCDDDDSNNNAGCERGCAEDYLGTVDSCEDETATCMAGCSAPDDTSCLWDCEVTLHECEFEMSACMAQCPCNDALSNCAAGCDYDDTGCVTACNEDYQDCNGGDSVSECVTACSVQRASCFSECEERPDMDDYLDCRAVCHQTFVGCLNDCV